MMGRKKQMDTSMYFCPNQHCTNYGKVGPDNQVIGAGRYGKQQGQLLKCKVCGQRFSTRRGTPLFDLKTEEQTFYEVIACLAEGNGIRATARIKNVDKDTVAAWFEAVQLDEFWSFVQKKKHSVHLGNDSGKPMETGGSG
jgi:transposase-like protein